MDLALSTILWIGCGLLVALAILCALAERRRARRRDMSSRDGDPGDSGEAEGSLRRRQRRDLGADAQAVAGIFHVGAGDDLAVDRLHRASDREAGIRRVGPQRGGAGALDEGVRGGIAHPAVIAGRRRKGSARVRNR
jgi:hypothetical protein